MNCSNRGTRASKLISYDAVCRVSALGIDSNIFASNYQKPKAWTHGDHIGVAMVSFSAAPPITSSQMQLLPCLFRV